MSPLTPLKAVLIWGHLVQQWHFEGYRYSSSFSRMCNIITQTRTSAAFTLISSLVGIVNQFMNHLVIFPDIMAWSDVSKLKDILQLKHKATKFWIVLIPTTTTTWTRTLMLNFRPSFLEDLVLSQEKWSTFVKNEGEKNKKEKFWLMEMSVSFLRSCRKQTLTTSESCGGTLACYKALVKNTLVAHIWYLIGGVTS